MGDNFSLSRGRSLARHALEKERVTKPKERPRGRLGCNFGAPCQIVTQAQTGLEWTALVKRGLGIGSCARLFSAFVNRIKLNGEQTFTKTNLRLKILFIYF